MSPGGQRLPDFVILGEHLPPTTQLSRLPITTESLDDVHPLLSNVEEEEAEFRSSTLRRRCQSDVPKVDDQVDEPLVPPWTETARSRSVPPHISKHVLAGLRIHPSQYGLVRGGPHLGQRARTLGLAALVAPEVEGVHNDRNQSQEACGHSARASRSVAHISVEAAAIIVDKDSEPIVNELLELQLRHLDWIKLAPFQQ